jgi:hypothetical protein
MHLELKMKPRIFIILTFVIGILFIGSRTNALQYTFHPRFSVTDEYTDNRDLTKNNKEEEFITVISAGFTAQALGKTSGLEVSYDPAYSIYYDSSDDNQLRHNANLRAWTAPSKNTTFEVSNKFFLTEDPQEGEEFLVIEEGVVEETGDTTIRKGRRKYYRNTANANLSYQFGKDDSMYAGFRYSILRNNDSQTEDNDQYSPYIGLNYRFGPKFGVMSEARYTRGIFDQDSDFVGEETSDFNNYAGTIRFIGRTGTRFSVFVQHNQIYRDFDENIDNDYMVYAPSTGFTYVVEKGLNLRLGAGYFYQEIDGDDDEQGLFGNSQIDKTWLYRRGSINLTALTGLAQNNFGAENVGLERFVGVQGSAIYQFARTLSGDLNGSYRYSDVVGQADQEGTGEKVHRYRAGTGLTYEPLKWMAIRLGYTFNKVNSENEEDGYEENRAFLRVTLQPDQPWRF